MASISIKNISEWSLSKKIISGVILLLIIWILWSVFGGKNAVTQSILNLPEASVVVINEDGTEIDLQVRVNDSGATLANVDQSLIEKTVLYNATAYTASAPVEINNISVPLAVALFDDEGNLINIYRVKANEQETIRPETRYKYRLTAKDEYFVEKGISIENGSKLLVESLQIVSE